MYDGWKPDEFHETLLDARKCRKISDKYNNIAEYSQILFISDKYKNIVEDRSYSQILYNISLAIRVAAENGRYGVIYILPYNLDNEVGKQIVRDLQCYHYTAAFTDNFATIGEKYIGILWDYIYDWGEYNNI